MSLDGCGGCPSKWIARLSLARTCCVSSRRRSRPQRWTRSLAEAGWAYATLAEPKPALAAGRTRPLIALVAARTPLEPVRGAGIPWPERVLGARVRGLEVINVHSPTSPKPNLAKVPTHEAVHEHPANGVGPRLVCGDPNTPRKEFHDGRVWTFARDCHGKLRPDRGERWDQAELALIKGLEPVRFRDAFRDSHGLELREVSWKWRRWGGGYRLDHLIISAEVRARQIRYLHDRRKRGLSDHSPLFARVSWDPAGSRYTDPMTLLDMSELMPDCDGNSKADAETIPQTSLHAY